MGSGKTVIGRSVAHILDYAFTYIDQYMRTVTGMDLPRLYKKFGEIRFRSEEKLAINKFASGDGQVIACGGSMVPTQENLTVLAQKGYIVLLSAAPEVIMERASRKNDRFLTGRRPSLSDICRMLDELRECFAEVEHVSIDTGAISVEEAAARVAEKYRAYLTQP